MISDDLLEEYHDWLAEGGHSLSENRVKELVQELLEMRQANKQERAAVVAWLRENETRMALMSSAEVFVWPVCVLDWVVERVEAGEHLKGGSK